MRKGLTKIFSMMRVSTRKCVRPYLIKAAVAVKRLIFNNKVVTTIAEYAAALDHFLFVPKSKRSKAERTKGLPSALKVFMVMPDGQY